MAERNGHRRPRACGYSASSKKRSSPSAIATGAKPQAGERPLGVELVGVVMGSGLPPRLTKTLAATALHRVQGHRQQPPLAGLYRRLCRKKAVRPHHGQAPEIADRQ